MMFLLFLILLQSSDKLDNELCDGRDQKILNNSFSRQVHTVKPFETTSNDEIEKEDFCAEGLTINEKIKHYKKPTTICILQNKKDEKMNSDICQRNEENGGENEAESSNTLHNKRKKKSTYKKPIIFYDSFETGKTSTNEGGEGTKIENLTTASPQCKRKRVCDQPDSTDLDDLQDDNKILQCTELDTESYILIKTEHLEVKISSKNYVILFLESKYVNKELYESMNKNFMCYGNFINKKEYPEFYKYSEYSNKKNISFRYFLNQTKKSIKLDKPELPNLIVTLLNKAIDINKLRISKISYVIEKIIKVKETLDLPAERLFEILLKQFIRGRRMKIQKFCFRFLLYTLCLESILEAYRNCFLALQNNLKDNEIEEIFDTFFEIHKENLKRYVYKARNSNARLFFDNLRTISIVENAST